MIHLKVSENEAQIALRRVQHQRFLDGYDCTGKLC